MSKPTLLTLLVIKFKLNFKASRNVGPKRIDLFAISYRRFALHLLSQFFAPL